jgi:RNA polymerase sigma-70 factor (ECF subfamily)
VQPLAGFVRNPQESFAPTHWSAIVAAGNDEADPTAAHSALSELCQTYWPPLYSFVRSRGYSIHDAQDLTQSFFVFLLDRKIYARADQAMGKFRSFLLASLKNFLANAYDDSQTLKRGGNRDFLPLNEEQAQEAESLFQTHHRPSSTPGDEDIAFERAWAEALVSSGLRRLADEYQAEGKVKLFEELKTFLTGSAEPLPSYEDLAIRLGRIASTLRSDVTRLRAQYREALRAEVRRTVNTEAEVESELRELLRVLTNR